MVSWWPGDGHTNDIHSNNNAVSYNGSFAAGQVGQAFDVDGVNDMANFGNPVNLQITQAITADAWISPDTTTAGAFKTVVSKFGQSDSAWGLFILQTSPGVATVQGFITRNDTVLVGVQGGVVPVGTGVFTHVAMSYSDADGMRIYVNGAQVAAGGAGSGPIKTSARNVTIGQDSDAAVSNRWFDGKIDEVEIFNRVLTGSEVFDLFRANTFGKCKPVCTPPPANMLAWYKGEGNFDDGAPPTFETGSASGTVNFAAGLVNQAFSFGGAGFVTVPAGSGPLNLTGTAVSIDGWINPINTNAALYFGKTAAGSND